MTEAGRRLLDAIFERDGGSMPLDPGAAIEAIEVEARRECAERIEREVRALPGWDKRTVPGGIHVHRAAILQIVRRRGGL